MNCCDGFVPLSKQRSRIVFRDWHCAFPPRPSFGARGIPLLDSHGAGEKLLGLEDTHVLCWDEAWPKNLPSPFGRGAGGEGDRDAAPLPPRVLTLSRRERGLHRRNRRGQSLVEFAIVSLVVYMLLAAILSFGQMLVLRQTVQQAADVAARELSRTPLPAVPDSQDPLYPNDPAYLNYVLYGDASSDPALTPVRQAACSTTICWC